VPTKKSFSGLRSILQRDGTGSFAHREHLPVPEDEFAEERLRGRGRKSEGLVVRIPLVRMLQGVLVRSDVLSAYTCILVNLLPSG
jgi:hypothetical protein